MLNFTFEELAKSVFYENPKATIEQIMEAWNWARHWDKVRNAKVSIYFESVTTEISSPDGYPEPMLVSVWFSDFSETWCGSEYDYDEEYNELIVQVDEEYPFETWRYQYEKVEG